MDLKESARRHGTYECMECGKCSYSCPAAHRDDRFSPRRIMEDFASGKDLSRREVWSCMTCGACSEICTSGVMFHEFIRDVRAQVDRTLPPIQSHNGILREIRRVEAEGRTSGHLTDWRTTDLEFDDRSDVALFVGCTPLFDQLFGQFAKDMLDVPRATVRLLNAVGIRPKLIEDERCCGHDSYWLGEDETFERLARLNLESIKRSGARTIITFCPECHHTLGVVYPRLFGDLGLEVRNSSEIIGRAVKEGTLDIAWKDEDLTYHDPCKLGRMAGVIEEPREILRKTGTLREMSRSGSTSACCGNPCWANCDDGTKRWQVDRLREARETGASCLVTACPKCYVHLSCAQKDYGTHKGRDRIDLIDLHVLAASRLVKRD